MGGENGGRGAMISDRGATAGTARLRVGNVYGQSLTAGRVTTDATERVSMTPPTSNVASGGSIAIAPRVRNARAAVVARAMLDPVSWKRVRLLTDLIVLYVASSLALFADANTRLSMSHRLMALVFPLVITGMMRTRRAPDERLHVSLLDTFAYVLGVVSLATMLLISVDSILGGANPLGLASRLWIFGVVYLGVARAMLVLIRRQAMLNERVATPTLIVGAGRIGSHLVKRLVGEPTYGLRPVGFLDSDPLPTLGATDLSVPVMGGTDDLASAIGRTGARHVILAFTAEPDEVLVMKVRECEALGVTVSLVPRLYESINERTTLDHVGGMPLLTLHTVDPRGWQFAIKHAIDRTFALLALVLASPVIALIALSVKLSSPGPILFRQRRVGRDGHEFDVLKFRTMRVIEETDPDFELPAGVAPGGIEGVDRRTRIGTILRDLSLDELPQLFNVLRGDMSLVGPRPERPEYVSVFVRDVARYQDRHRVKSGITGWAQVNGLRGQTSIHDRVEWDNYYIQNWSLKLDFRVMALTLAEMFRGRDSADARPGRQPSASPSEG
jgi:exopolysaccharide biosynthesis polyprenyl glycosylphosphotransferase